MLQYTVLHHSLQHSVKCQVVLQYSNVAQLQHKCYKITLPPTLFQVSNVKC